MPKYNKYLSLYAASVKVRISLLDSPITVTELDVIKALIFFPKSVLKMIFLHLDSTEKEISTDLSWIYIFF